MFTDSTNRSPPRYFPFATGKYDLPGPWHPLELNRFGNGQADKQVFQLDREFDLYRREKLRARRLHFASHVCEHELPYEGKLRDKQQLHADEAKARSEEAALRDLSYGRVARFIVRRLLAEYPDTFTLSHQGDCKVLDCSLTGERLVFDEGWRLCTNAGNNYRPAMSALGYKASEGSENAALDALACQIQEDFAIVRLGHAVNTLLYTHVCMPSGWRPKEMIGLSFADIHDRVPGFGGKAKRGEMQYVAKMLSATDGLVRFVWGVQVDDSLNHHPETCETSSFDSETPSGFARVERQTVLGFPDWRMVLFTIRLYLVDLEVIRRNPTLRSALAAAIQGMTKESLRFKGLDEWAEPLLDWFTK